MRTFCGYNGGPARQQTNMHWSGHSNFDRAQPRETGSSRTKSSFPLFYKTCRRWAGDKYLGTVEYHEV